MTLSAPADGPERRGFVRLALAAAAVYALILAASVRSVGRSDVAYWIAVAVLIPATAFVIRASRFPPSFFGLTWRGGRRSVHSATVSCALLAAAMLLALQVAGMLELPELARAALGAWRDPQVAAYVVLAVPLQELLFRGVFQNGARYLAEGARFPSSIAVLCSTVAFALSHLPFGTTTALVMIIPGLVWGVQYERDRTLAGVLISHVVIGYLFVGATPLWRMVAG